MVTTQRIKNFVDEYEANGFTNQKAAAIAAGYAASGASANARKLLKDNKWVIGEVKRRKAAAELRARASASADLDELIRLLSDIARENFCSFFYEEDGELRMKKWSSLTEDQQRLIKGLDRNGMPVLHDKLDAMRMMLDIYGKRNDGAGDEGGVVVLPEVRDDA